MLDFDVSLAIVIGIDRYQNGIAPLRTAVSDAQAIAQLLLKDHGYEVICLLDEKAQLSSLIALITKTLPDLLSENSRLLLYFAGHGLAQDGDDGPAGYLLPQDCTPGVVESYWPMAALHDALTALECRHFLAIFDCCFAGAFRWSSTRDIQLGSAVIHQERFDRFQHDPAWQVITSAAYDQKAVDAIALQDDRGIVDSTTIDSTEPDKEQHSPFAFALLQALSGKADSSPPATDDKPAGDGVITATELYLYLRDSVEDLTVGERKRQTPGLCSLKKHDKGEYIFLTPGHELNLPPAPELNKENNPYRGLESFDQVHSKLFFGRDKEIQELLEQVVLPHPLTVVLGASGTGKSSLVKAGLLPALVDDPRFKMLPVVRPAAQPMEALALSCAALALEDGLTVSRLLQRFRTDEQALRQLLDHWLMQHVGKKVLLVIDQFEELVTQCSPKRAYQFQQLLKQAMDAHGERLHVLVTLRLGFETQFQNSVLKPYWRRSRFIVSPMTQDELRRAIEGPAQERILYFKPPSLVERLINEVIQMPGALPLLSFTLSELYLKYLVRRNGDRALTEQDYESLGGVVGSLTQRATQEYELLVARQPLYAEIVEQVMLRMVSVEGGEVARRRVLREELKYAARKKNTRVEAVIKQYAEARLLISSQDEDGDRYVEPAHDALVKGWDKLLAWRAGSQETLSFQRLVRSATTAWKANDYNVDDLWHNNPRLPQLIAIEESKSNWLNKLEQLFCDRSVKRRRKRRILLTGLGISVAGALLSIAALAVGYAGIAEERRQVSSARQLATQADFTFLLQKPHLLSRSVLLAIQAAKQFPDGTLESKADIDQALRRYVSLGRESASWESQQPVLEANFSDDGRWLAIAGEDGVVKIVDRRSDRIRLRIKHEKAVRDVQFSPDSQLVATASDDASSQVWNLRTEQFIDRFPHGKTVKSVRFSPDSRQIATASQDNCVRLWNISSERINQPVNKVGEKRENKPEKLVSDADCESSNSQTQFGVTNSAQLVAKVLHTADVTVANFSPNGDFLISASSDTTARLLEISTGKKTVIKHKGKLNDAQFSPDGLQVATADSKGNASVWTLKSLLSGKIVPPELFSHDGVVYDVRFSPDSQQLATSGSDNKAKVWQISPARLLATLSHGNEVWDVRWHSDGRRVATASADNTARLWDVITREELLRFNEEAPIYDVRFAPDISDRSGSRPGNKHQLMTNSQSGMTRVWTTHASSEVARFVGRDGSTFNNVRFSPDSQWLAASGVGPDIYLWNMRSQKQLTLSHRQSVSEIDFSPDGRYLVSASEDATARLWRVDDGKTLFEIQRGAEVTNVSFRAEDGYLVTASADGTACVWDISTRQMVRCVRHSKLEGTLSEAGSTIMRDARLSPDGKLLATASDDNTARLWRLSDGKEVAVIEHNNDVRDVRFSSDGKVLATASLDTNAQLFDVDKLEQIALMDDHFGAVFDVRISPDNRFVATSSQDGTARLWNARTGELLRVLNHDESVLEVNFSEDSRRVATVSADKLVRVWDVRRGYQVARAAGSGALRDTRFSLDGQWLATVSALGVATVHHLSTLPLIEAGCDRLTRNLTVDEWTRFVGEKDDYKKTCPDLDYPPDYEEK